MLLDCPGCRRKLKLNANLAGRRVRCPGCQTAITVPTAAAEAPRPANESPPKHAEPAPPPTEAPGPTSMRCAKCRSATVAALRANLFSRHPGYQCTSCQALMRAPGTTGTNLFVATVGIMVFFLGLGLCGFVLAADALSGIRLSGAAAICFLGAAAAAWSIHQLRRPIPLDAPRGRSRWVLWIILVVVALVVGVGGVFGFMYILQEAL